ncbi:antibiotic biosynthesis monooxygenase [Streptomyces albipurpureus]|uniref:Antibiotic biosynthesis monooxygenase n=1 Tax=Streptomyces albipurpureus TaxID=2897419 RepID=A0ABT0UTG6_9ACTN|nr:antibiotic biosynthesis monooxygenase [Streptomyces sp. CWNU-1]MCM2390895.1 antibiotic biosynthesis monooxygenase [Streptomyces sp. CWNU-1]
MILSLITQHGPYARPVVDRPDAQVVKVSTWDVGTPERQRAAVDALEKAWRSRGWPGGGLLTYTVHMGDDGRTLLHYTQWTSEEAFQEFLRTAADFKREWNAEVDAAVPGIERLGLRSYELYRSGSTPADPRIPGTVVIVDVEFDGPDADRQRAWVDTVFTALEADTAGTEGPRTAEPGPRDDPRSAGISGHFHLSQDGTRVLNYAEWESAEAHQAALAAPGEGIGSTTAQWARVHDFPGVRGSSVRRYTPGLTLGPGV